MCMLKNFKEINFNTAAAHFKKFSFMLSNNSESQFPLVTCRACLYLSRVVSDWLRCHQKYINKSHVCAFFSDVRYMQHAVAWFDEASCHFLYYSIGRQFGVQRIWKKNTMKSSMLKIQKKKSRSPLK